MGAGYNFDQDTAVSLVMNQQSLVEATQKFAKAGTDRIKECGIQGGAQAAKIEALVETIDDKFKEAMEFNTSTIEAIENVIVNIGNFDMQTILNKVTEQVEGIQKADKVVSKKVDFI